MKETLRRRISVMSSLNEISKDQLRNRLAVRGKECHCIHPLPPLSTATSGELLKDDVNGFSSASDICFRV
jgi:hypothetical protein